MKYLLIVVIFLLSCASKSSDDESAILCKILSDEKVVKYLHLENYPQIPKIKIVDSFNFFRKVETENSFCLGKKLK